MSAVPIDKGDDDLDDDGLKIVDDPVSVFASSIVTSCNEDDHSFSMAHNLSLEVVRPD